MALLFAALYELKACRTKAETIAFIREHHWFAIQPEDMDPYPSAATREPRWHTAIAWSRKDAVVAELMFKHGPDQWELTRSGIDAFELVKARCRSGDFEVRKCFFWSLGFKQWIAPGFKPSGRDWPRPDDIYEDIQRPTKRSIRDRVVQKVMDDLLN
jgi:hypothetical protein